MNRILIIVLIGCLLSCHAQPTKTKQEKALDSEIEKIRVGNPGLKEVCLEKLRSGQIGVTQWMDNPDCFDMLPPQRWTGLWNTGWEWTNFCPAPANNCPSSSEKGDIWLAIARDAYQGPELADGVYRIDFIGRRTRVPGYFGHLNQYDHLMVLDRLISIQKVPGENYAKRF